MAPRPQNTSARGAKATPAWMKALLGMVGGVALLALGALSAKLYERYGAQVHARAKEKLAALKERAALPEVKLPEVVERGPSRVVYLNREGATLTQGMDDAGENVSSIVAGAGLNWVDVPPFAGNSERWEQVVKCVRSKFAAYDVRVTDQRPVTESYVMAVVGGTPKILGDDLPLATQNVTGLAPFNGKAIRNAVVMVFSRSMKEQVRGVCETAAMEVAHAFGLDHARNCKDIMTYMKPCGPRAFLDEAIACGEYEDRACKDEAPTQNSHARLLATLGPAPVEAPARPPQKGTVTETGNRISAGPVVADDGHFHVH